MAGGIVIGASRTRSNAVHSQLRAGDIMIKYNDGGAVSNVIQLGQLFGRGSSKFTHAGIMSSATTIIEMSGSGLNENNLLTKNSGVNYEVFRCIDAEVAAGAAETAKMMYAGVQGGGMKVSYDMKGSVGSILSRKLIGNKVLNTDLQLDRLMSGKGAAYFCSGHVVLCYQAAIAQIRQASAISQNVFPVQDAGKMFNQEQGCYQPAFLEKMLRKSTFFTALGKFRGVHRAG